MERELRFDEKCDTVIQHKESKNLAVIFDTYACGYIVSSTFMSNESASCG